MASYQRGWSSGVFLIVFGPLINSAAPAPLTGFLERHKIGPYPG